MGQYKEDQQWKIYRHERNKLNYMISEKKTKILSNQILMCKGDTKALYKTSNKITGSRLENQMPEGRSESRLATEFSEVLTNKIWKIKDELEDKPKFVAKTNHSIAEFSKFKILIQDVEKLLKGMETRSCELDVIPTNIL